MRTGYAENQADELFDLSTDPEEQTNLAGGRGEELGIRASLSFRYIAPPRCIIRSPMTGRNSVPSSQRFKAGHAVSQPAATLALGLHQSANGIAPYLI